MFKKSILFLFILFFLNQCGFEPIHLNKSNNNFTIEELNFKGDKIINSFLKINLKKFKKNNLEKKFSIFVDTTYKKNTLSKDKKAKVSNYKLVVNSTFKIVFKGKEIKRLTVSDSKNIDYIEDKLEEEKYEKVIKKTFASTITNKLINELSQINVN